MTRWNPNLAWTFNLQHVETFSPVEDLVSAISDDMLQRIGWLVCGSVSLIVQRIAAVQKRNKMN
jgi:hypothetical protein